MNLEVIKKILDNDIPIVIENYIQLKDNISLDQLSELKKIFDQIKSHELKSINIKYNGLIEDGLKMIPKDKKNLNILDDDLIKKIIKQIDNIDNIKDGYYIKTFITLLKNINFIDFEEQVLLNILFEEISVFDKKLECVEDKSFMIK